MDSHPYVSRPTGEIDLATAPELQQSLLAAVRFGKRDIIVDLTEVEFIDSTGLRTLLMVQEKLEELGGSLAVVCPSPNVYRVFEITGLDDVLNVSCGVLPVGT